MAELKCVSLCKGEEGGETREEAFFVCAGRSGGTVSEGHPCSHHNAALGFCDDLGGVQVGMQLQPASFLIPSMCLTRSRGVGPPGLCARAHTHVMPPV